MGKDQELLEAARSGNVTVVEKILGQRAKRSGPLARWVSPSSGLDTFPRRFVFPSALRPLARLLLPGSTFLVLPDTSRRPGFQDRQDADDGTMSRLAHSIIEPPPRAVLRAPIRVSRRVAFTARKRRFPRFPRRSGIL
jgi:hypothetical protein